MARLSLLVAILAPCLPAVPIYIATQDFQSGFPGSNNQIGIVNPTTGVVSSVHTLLDTGGGQVQMFDIAADLMGDIWGIDFNSGTSPNQHLFKIDPATGIATLMATFSGLPAGTNINGMDFNPATGLLFMSANNFPNDPTARLYTTNVNTCAGTCALTNVLSGTLANGSGGDIVFVNGELIFAAEGGILYRLVENAGLWSLSQTSTVTVGGFGTTIKGLAYDGTKLYAGALIDPNVSANPHAIVEIDLATLTAVGSPAYITGTVHTVAGLTTVGVPEPAYVIPSALGLLFVLHRRRRDTRATLPN